MARETYLTISGWGPIFGRLIPGAGLYATTILGLMTSALSPTFAIADEQPSTKATSAISQSYIPPKVAAKVATTSSPPIPRLSKGSYGMRAISLPKTGQQELSANQIGYGRELESLDTPQKFDFLPWEPTSDGGYGKGVQVRSTEAQALRLGLWVKDIPLEAEISFYSSANTAVTVVPAAAILESIGRNLSAGDPEETARFYWSPVMMGEVINFEVYLPTGVDTSEVMLAVPKISHISGSMSPSMSTRDLAKTGNTRSIGPSNSWSCHKDFQCDSSGQTQATAVGSMWYTTEDGGTAVCTGTLLNDLDTSTSVPYFISANHCISTQSIASTLVVYFNYQSTSCDSTDYSFDQHLGGATLLYKTENTDTALFRLNSTPAVSVVLAGWNASIPDPYDSIVGIHHPAGDMKKISKGNITNHVNCSWTTSPSYTCSTTTGTPTDFSVTWSFDSGVTQGGSSGSGLFWGTNRQFIGTLRGGSSSCLSLGPDSYGVFATPYLQSLYQWLGVASGSTTCGQVSAVMTSRSYLNSEYELCEGTSTVAARTSVRVESGATVRYKAPQVSLGAGFSVAQGAEFRAAN